MPTAPCFERPRRAKHRRSGTPRDGAAIALSIATLFGPGCGPRPTPDATGRFFAVHNALRAVGLTQVGPISRGTLAPGQSAALPLPLEAGCVAVVAIGAAGVRDLDLKLVDPDGNAVAADDVHDADAVVRACVERPGSYRAVLTMTEGGGDYLLSSWTGGEPARAQANGAETGGTCDAPAPLALGSNVSGTTDQATDEQQGSCGGADGRDRVYRLDLLARQRVTLDLSADFDSVLYVRRETCADDAAEVVCNDDAAGQSRKSRVDVVLDPGAYFVVVDSYASEPGHYRLETSAEPAPTLADICSGARPISSGARLSGNLHDAFDNAHAGCGMDAKGADAPYRFDLPVRSRVRLVEQADDFHPVLHVRRTCEDESTELGCSDASLSEQQASWVGLLDPGSYTAFVDGSDESTDGTYRLTMETADEAGAPGSGSACGDARLLSPDGGRIEGDTFSARDGASVSCGGRATADVTYRLELGHRSRVTARLAGSESMHVLGLTRGCGPGAQEEACGASIDRVVPPGSYSLVVDSPRSDAFGKFAMTYEVRDVEALEAACAKVPSLAIGRAVAGTTVGAGDKFTPSCGGGGGPSGSTSSDRVYQFSVRRRGKVRLTLSPEGFSGVLSVRRACADDASEVRCAKGGSASSPAQLVLLLEPGTYYAVVDGSAGSSSGRGARSGGGQAGARNEGRFSLKLEQVD